MAKAKSASTSSATDQKVQNYIQTYTKKGYTREEITKALVKSGVDEATIKRNMKKASGKKPLTKDWRFWAIVAGGIILLIVLLALILGGGEECQVDRDCSRGFICESGSCIAEPVILPECTSDLECSSDEACINGDCVFVGVTDECTFDSDCPLGEECVSGQCVEEAVECVFDSDCAEGEECLNGACLASIEPIADELICDEDYTLSIGETIEYEGQTIELLDVTDTDADIDVDGTSTTIDLDDTVSVNGLDITVTDVFEAANTADSFATISTPCLECTDDTDCSDGFSCDTDDNTCYNSCEDNAAANDSLCQSGFSCDTTTFECVADDLTCIDDTNCSAGMACDPITSMCLTECTTDDECSADAACATDGLCHTCVDSDSGADQYTFGTTSGVHITSDEFLFEEPDTCAFVGPAGSVTEYYCTDSGGHQVLLSSQPDCLVDESCVAGFCEPLAGAGTTECSDLLDNDGDGAADYPEDRGCRTVDDTQESTECKNGIDDDGDGLIDYPNDLECSSEADETETLDFRCDDDYDNDGDRLADFPDDPGCSDALDDDERDSTVSFPAPTLGTQRYTFIEFLGFTSTKRETKEFQLGEPGTKAPSQRDRSRSITDFLGFTSTNPNPKEFQLGEPGTRAPQFSGNVDSLDFLGFTNTRRETKEFTGTLDPGIGRAPDSPQKITFIQFIFGVGPEGAPNKIKGSGPLGFN